MVIKNWNVKTGVILALKSILQSAVHICLSLTTVSVRENSKANSQRAM